MPALASLITPTPIGDALLVASPSGLLSLELIGSGGAGASGGLGASDGPGASDGSTGPDEPGAARIVRQAAHQLDAYFAGTLRTFSVPLDWSGLHGFSADALRAVTEIPYGETAAYGEVAIMAGRPRAARAVGTACARSPWSVIVPVHRVVRADGTIGPYGNNPEAKRFLVTLEQEHTR